MKLFIASHSQEEALSLRNELLRRGHEITARWITKDEKFSQSSAAYTDAERTELSLVDEADVRAATDGLILIAEPHGRTVPGGKHVETGMALALERPVFVIGRRENLFHWHPRVRVFPDADRFFEFLGSADNQGS